jgi:hypothetical protein
LKGIPAKEVQRHLKSNPRSFFGSAARDLRKRWQVELQRLTEITAEA